MRPPSSAEGHLLVEEARRLLRQRVHVGLVVLRDVNGGVRKGRHAIDGNALRRWHRPPRGVCVWVDIKTQSPICAADWARKDREPRGAAYRRHARCLDRSPHADVLRRTAPDAGSGQQHRGWWRTPRLRRRRWCEQHWRDGRRWRGERPHRRGRERPGDGGWCRRCRRSAGTAH